MLLLTIIGGQVPKWLWLTQIFLLLIIIYKATRMYPECDILIEAGNTWNRAADPPFSRNSTFYSTGTQFPEAGKVISMATVSQHYSDQRMECINLQGTGVQRKCIVFVYTSDSEPERILSSR
jgi:hypothetical protein